ncbi:flagellar filament capping protein FliD [Clostridium sp. C8-1-8]|uniref:flagellar filament capping protein FliD n=1 Tax=Clostridium sp. C8-1-8 TaxID=2698831 RepID=UPI00136922BF|nr:flagellar filament capping protein FliD [Clostridium sp. C8-1-8]
MNISSTSSSSSNSSANYGRITGLATGMDTDGMVKQALAADQTKIDAVKQDVQYTQWQQEAYVGFIKDLKEFNNYFDIVKPDNMMLSGAYTGTTTSTALTSGVDASNYLTATTLPGAVKGNYQVQINNLAESAKTQNYFNTVTADSVTTADQWSGKKLSFTVDGKTTDITLGTFTAINTLDDVVSDINNKLSANNNLNGKISAGVNSSSGKVTLSSSYGSDVTYVAGDGVFSASNKTLKAYTGDTKLSDLGIGSGSFTVSVEGKTFSVAIDNTKTISEFESDLLTVKSGDTPITQYLNINFSDLTKKLTIETKDTGLAEKINFSGDTSGFLNKFGLSGDHFGKDANISIKAPGETSFVQVNKSSNIFTIDSIKYNLVSAKPGDTISLNVKSDASAQVDKFKKFIDKYNELIDKINSKINEKKSYDYKPLTDTQKSSMKDTEITAWENKAKEGILRRDSYLTNVVSQMRQAVYDTVKGAGISITEIGITTTSIYSDGGKLQVDDSKLKAALEQKGDLVQKLFTQSSTVYGEKGIFQRFKDVLNNAVGTDGSLIKKAGYTDTRWVSENDLSKNIATKNAKIKDMQSMMTQKQQRLYSMYATLEQNMNNLNSQSSWLASSLGAQ